MNPKHRYAIHDTSHGSRLVATAATEEGAIRRADACASQARHPMAVIDTHNPILKRHQSVFGTGTITRELPRIVYEVTIISAESPRRPQEATR
jgi:hypothetical protein